MVRTIWEPLYQRVIQPTACEIEIMQSTPFRRLKHLHHYGASAMVTPVVHSRYEHTIGVWSIIEKFFPEQVELRLAALLHDIGHLPFSHAVEKTLGFDHHTLTQEFILESEVAGILKQHGFSPAAIIKILDEDTPLTNQTNILGADHLDSFLRDTYYAGRYTLEPRVLFTRLSYHEHFIQTDEETALALIDTIVQNHNIYLSPNALAVDAVLAQAIHYHFQEIKEDTAFIRTLTDYELLSILQNSSNQITRQLIAGLLYQPHLILTREEPIEDIPEMLQIPLNVRKVYKKTPMVGGKPVIETNASARQKLNLLDQLVRTTYLDLSRLLSENKADLQTTSSL